MDYDWDFDFFIGAREEFHESVGSDGYLVTRWGREINGTFYSFVRVEDGNRNASIDVVIERQLTNDRSVLEYVHTFRGKTNRPKPGLVAFSEELGRRFL